MTTPGGTRTRYRYNYLRVRLTGFYDGSEPPGLLGSGPSLCPCPMLQGQPALTFVDNGGAACWSPHSPPGSYHSPSKLLSKHMAAGIRMSLKDTTMDINNV
jgi:hypothetical protein